MITDMHFLSRLQNFDKDSLTPEHVELLEPYLRDPDFTVENTALDTVGETGATLHPRTRVVSVDPEAHEVTTQGGETVGYGRVLVATGGRPRTLTDLPGGDRVLYYRSLTDYHRLRVLADTRPHVAVVGGGYIGTEIAAAMVGEGCRVTLLHPSDVLRP